MNWYKLHTENDVDTPALLVYPDRIRQNIDMLKSMIDDPDRLRPHIKTHKTEEILRMQLEAGIVKYKCATIAEAELLGQCGAPDVLLAYPLYGPKLRRFIALVKEYHQTKYAAIVDNQDAARELSDRAVQHEISVDVYIDLHIGMGRTGIPPGERALELYRLCHEMKGLLVQGFHAYDGHVREINIEKRKEICARNYEPIAHMVEQCVQEGFVKPRVIIGGSPSFPIYAQYPEVECSPGTFVLWDKGYADTLPEQDFLPAAVLMTRIVSLPSESTICVDLGYKAIAAENALENRVFFLDAPDLKPLTHSEEHLGDIDHVAVPLERLLDTGYIRSRMKDFVPLQPSKNENIKVSLGKESEETTHFSIIDKEGNMVSLTTTINASYGSRVVVGGAGFILNNGMDNFSAKPGTPNRYGLLGSEANSISPGKRMLSSMTPTIVKKEGKPYLVIGTPGGSTIITSVFQALINILEFDMSAYEAVNRPKFHHQWYPDVIYIERDFDDHSRREVESLGYVLEERDDIGRTEALLIRNGVIEAVGDKRRDDSVAGY